MGKLETIAVLGLIDTIAKIGETFFDGDRKDDLDDVINALKGVFGFEPTECKGEDEDGKEG